MAQSNIKLPAPAKINLFLHICGRRPDGYHELQTVFQFLDYCDELTFSLNNTQQINLLTDMGDLKSDDNLIIKAAKLLQQHTNTCQGADIDVKKILPMGGGIGGGSSNAATTLVALNRLWALHLDTEELKSIGVTLGADVPVFIHGHSAWAEGIGENLTNIDAIEPWYVLLIPHCHVSTASIFSHSELTRDTKMLKIAAFLEQSHSDTFHNDCENLVRKLYPEVDKALKALSAHGKARMTGTGACVFASYSTREEAQSVADLLSNKDDFDIILCQGTNRSPLYQALESVS